MNIQSAVSILVIGDELLSGAVTDTNGPYFCNELADLGWSVVRILVVGDEFDAITDALKLCVSDSAVVLITGGLGPTSDDITRDGVARFLNVPVILDAEALSRMEGKYRERRVSLNKISERQAQFPEGAKILPNNSGTAEGFSTECFVGDRSVAIHSLPGIPREVHSMWRDTLRDWFVLQRNSNAEPETVHIKCFGLSESYIGTLIEAAQLKSSVRVGYRPVYPEVWVRLIVAGDRDLLDHSAQKVIEAIGPAHVFSQNVDDDLPTTLGKLLDTHRLTLSFAESCTGGLAAHQIVNRPGSSRYLKGSVVAYSNELKTAFLGVSPEIFEKFGAVSAECALSMAQGMKLRSNSDYAVSITGVAGPDGGTEEKPVGTVWFGLVTPTGEYTYRFQLPFGRNRCRAYAATLACELVRRDLLGLPHSWERQ